MHRSKAFMSNLGEDILMHMEKMDKNISPAHLTMLASMAEDYNKLCKFLEKHGEHKAAMDKDAGSNPRSTHIKTDSAY